MSEHRAGLETANVEADPPTITGKADVTGEANEKRNRDSTGVVVAARTEQELCETREVCVRGAERKLGANAEPSEGQRRRTQMTDGLVVPKTLGNTGGGKGP